MQLKHKVVFNIVWSVTGQLSSSVIQLFANILYARFLSPTEFGQLGIVMFFVLLSNVLVEGGLGGALVRKLNATQLDYTTVFIFNFFLSLILYLLIVINAGAISNFYDDPRLKSMLVFAGMTLILNSFNIVQDTRLVKNLMFKKIAIYRLIAIVFSHIIGLTLVVHGFGIWALIVAVLINPLVLSIILWSREGRIGRLRFSLDSFKSLYAFGINTSLASILDSIFNNIYQVILARYFSMSVAGLFFQAKKLQDVPNSIIFSTTNTVVYSSLAKLQNEPKKFENAYNKFISYFSVMMGIVTLLTIVYSKEIIITLFGARWEGAARFLIILSVFSFFYVHELFNRVIFKTFNRTRFILHLEFFKKFLLLLSIIAGIYFLEINILLAGLAIISCISYFINYYFSRKLMGKFSWAEIVVIIKVIISVSITVFIISLFNLNMRSYLMLLTFPAPILTYLIILRLLGFKISKSFIKEILNMIRISKIQS